MTSPALQQKSPEIKIDHLGLIAGEGSFPLLVARAARKRSIPVTAAGLTGLTSPALEAEVTQMHWLKLSEFYQMIRLFQANGISKTIMAGRVKHSSIFQADQIGSAGAGLNRLEDKKADSVLGFVAQELAKSNIEVLDQSLFLADYMPAAGLLTPGRPPTKEIEEDIAFGMTQAKGLAGMDIGQTVVVKGKTVVAAEAMEGTNAAITRGGQVAGEGTVVVKVSKPNQDKRFDIPVLGPRTIERMAQAKAAALGFEGGEVLFFDQAEAVALAEKNGITIIGA